MRRAISTKFRLVSLVMSLFLALANAVSVEVPASNTIRAVCARCAVCAGRAVRAVRSRCSIVSFATGDGECEEQAHNKADKAEFRAYCPSHF